MKSLNPSQPLVIMLVGLPGSGKSFFARQFAQTFAVPTVSFNRIRHELFEHPTFSQDQEDLVSRLAECQLIELLITQRSLILDGGCNTKLDRQHIATLAKTAGYATLLIWVQTDPVASKQRALKRKSNRPEDILTSPLTTKQFDTLAKQFAAPATEDHIVISGKHVYATQARMVLRKIAQPHQDQIAIAHTQEVRATPQRPAARRQAPIRRAIIR